MKSLLKRIYFLNLGLKNKYDQEQKIGQRLFLINIVIVLFLAFFIFYDFVVDFIISHRYSLANIPVFLFWANSVVCLLFIWKKKLLPAKLLSVFLPPVFILSYIFIEDVTCGYFLWQPIALIGLSIIPVLVFDYRKEKALLVVSAITYLLIISFYDRILSMGVNSYYTELYLELNTNPFIYKSVQIAIFAFIFTASYYAIKINNHQQLINERINEALLRERNNLEALNAEMQAQRNAINKSASLVITDEEGNIQFTNNNFCIATGYSNKELIGKNPRILNSGYHDDSFFRDLWQTIKSGEVWRGEIRNKKKDNTYYWLDTAIAPIFNRANNQKGYLAIRFDCTVRKKYERELKELNKSNKNLIYSIAHDLRSPFLNFKSLLSLNKLNLLKEKESEKVIDQLIQDCEYSLILIDELVMAGSIENINYALEKKKIYLNEFLDKSIAQFDEQINKMHFTILKDYQKDLPMAEINEDKFNRTIRNLVLNAIKFTPPKGQIEVKTKLVPDNKILISISDSGIGISKEIQPYIFDKFTKFSKQGLNGERSSGLGLWIAKRIIELHEGEINVESAVGKGTTFSILLPKC